MNIVADKISMENTARLETAHKPTHRADEANFLAIYLMGTAAVETIRAHNPEVAGSNPTPATKIKTRGAL